jgi:hypothetical protein
MHGSVDEPTQTVQLPVHFAVSARVYACIWAVCFPLHMYVYKWKLEIHACICEYVSCYVV